MPQPKQKSKKRTLTKKKKNVHNQQSPQQIPKVVSPKIDATHCNFSDTTTRISINSNRFPAHIQISLISAKKYVERKTF